MDKYSAQWRAVPLAVLNLRALLLQQFGTTVTDRLSVFFSIFHTHTHDGCVSQSLHLRNNLTQ